MSSSAVDTLEPMSIVAIIPARGGSKGIPRKNLCDLAGKPLLWWTIQAARRAKTVTRTLVSTEDDEIAKVARAAGAEVPFMRPETLADGAVHSVHVVLHALDWLAVNEDYVPDVVVMLLPTSPFRTERHIDEAAKLYLQHNVQSVVSVCRHHKHLFHLRTIQDGFLKPVQQAGNLNVQRQDLEDVYALNGSIYVSSPACLMANKSFHLEQTLPYVMPYINSIDINETADLELARAVAKQLIPLR